MLHISGCEIFTLDDVRKKFHVLLILFNDYGDD